MQEALFYDKKEDNLTACCLCPKMCTIKDGKAGFCRVRQNRKGKLYAVNYGECSSYALDPIEKKPLYHFYPGSYIFSLGTVGCNLKCGFCQNWEIAHGDPKTVRLVPEQVVKLALEQQGNYPNIGIAYTYSEPFMWYEFVYDTSQKARDVGLKNVLVTNGYINEAPLRNLLPYIDAMNVDVKAFKDKYYRETCNGRLEPVLRTVEIAFQACHIELTTLLVPGLNDSPEEIEELVDWVAALDKDIPLHFSRYFPNYKFNLEPTPLSSLKKAEEIARKKLPYVYLGNVVEPDAGNTYCPECGQELIKRVGYNTRILGLGKNHCRNCGYRVRRLEIGV